MKDRSGKTIYIAWARHEFIWLEAAMTLPKKQRLAAYRDISNMTGRSMDAIARQAYNIECKRQEAALKDMRDVRAQSAGAVSPPLQCAPANLRQSEIKPVPHGAFYSEVVRQTRPTSLASKGVQIGQPSPPTPAAFLDTHPFSGVRT